MAKKKNKEPILPEGEIEAPKGFPDSVRIFTDLWTIHYVHVVEKGSQHSLGSCEPQAREILIDKDQSQGSMIETLIHEIFHAYLSTLPSNLDPEFEEQWVQYITRYFLDLVRNIEPFWWEEGE